MKIFSFHQNNSIRYKKRGDVENKYVHVFEIRLFFFLPHKLRHQVTYIIRSIICMMGTSEELGTHKLLNKNKSIVL